MQTKLNKYLNSSHNGFMGRTHVMLTIGIFMCIWLIPKWVPIIGKATYTYLTSIKSSILFLILNFIVICGASLLPDLDSSPGEGGNSTAIQELGFLGTILSFIEVTIAHAIWEVFHFKSDKRPKSGHRLLWHTIFIAILFYIWVMCVFPYSNKTVLTILHTKYGLNISAIAILFIYSIAAYIGMDVLTYRILNLFKLNKFIQPICWFGFVISFVLFISLPLYQLRLVGLTLAFGYSCHVIEDLFTQGGTPFMFPIPMPHHGKLCLWKTNYLPYNLSVETGGMTNTIIDYLALAFDLFLVWLIFFKGII